MATRKDKFYRVLRNQHPSGNAGRTHFISYLQGLATQQPVDATVTARGNKTTLYIKPFSIPLATATVLQVSAMEDAWNALNGIAPTLQHVTNVLAPAEAVKIQSYRAPRVSIKRLIGGVETARSKYTNWQYKKVKGTSISIPFGRNIAGDTVSGVYGDLKAAYTVGHPTWRFTLIEESI